MTSPQLLQITPPCHSRESGNPEKLVSKIAVDLSSKEDLFSYFNQLCNKVPEREENRYKERQIAKEIFCIERYLCTLAKHQKLEFPINLQQDESTDFFICSQNMVTGLEITEATTQAYQKWLNETAGQTALFPDGGYVGDQQQRLVCDSIKERIETKNKKLSEYQQNNPDCHDWRLLIYESIALGNICEEDMNIIFNRLKHILPTISHQFSEISVITGNHLLYFPLDSRFRGNDEMRRSA